MDAAPAALPETVLAQLEALSLDPGRPLIAVDADEVLVHFARHLADHVAAQGYRMRLTEYRLEGAIRDAATGEPVPFDGAIALIGRFFAEEVHRQEAIDGAAAALARLSARAQVVVLTNVPEEARAGRVENLAGLGMAYPLVQNVGGKGPALAWMAARTARAAFLDDSAGQIASVRKAVPGAFCLHFRGSPYIAGVLPACAEADRAVADWAEAEAVLRDWLGG